MKTIMTYFANSTFSFYLTILAQQGPSVELALSRNWFNVMTLIQCWFKCRFDAVFLAGDFEIVITSAYSKYRMGYVKLLEAGKIPTSLCICTVSSDHFLRTNIMWTLSCFNCEQGSISGARIVETLSSVQSIVRNISSLFTPLYSYYGCFFYFRSFPPSHVFSMFSPTNLQNLKDVGQSKFITLPLSIPTRRCNQL